MAPIQFIINFTSFSLASFLIYWSKAGHLKSFIQQAFGNSKLNTFELQADHLANVAYYYAIYVILVSSIVSAIRFFRGEVNQAIKPDINFVQSLNKAIMNSTEHLVIFMSIYVYLLQQKGLGLKGNSLLVLPFWFIVGRVGTLVEQMLSQVLRRKFIFSYFGLTLTIFPYLVMIGQILGYSPLKLF